MERMYRAHAVVQLAYTRALVANCGANLLRVLGGALAALRVFCKPELCTDSVATLGRGAC